MRWTARWSLPLAFFAAACGGQRTDSPAEPPDHFLRATVLNESDSLGRLSDIAVNGDRLLAIDMVGDATFHLLDTGTGALLASFGRSGEGPGEFRSARKAEPVVGDHGAFWVYDIELRRMTYLDTERIITDSAALGAASVSFHAGELPMSPVWLGSEVVSPGILKTGRLGVFDSLGGLRRTMAQVPTDAREHIPLNVLQHAWTGTLVVRPGGSLLALGARHANRIDIYRPDGTLAATGRGMRTFGPVFHVQARNGVPYMASGEDLRFGYIDLWPTADRIFALYSGRMRREHPGRASYADEVHVFDWNGRLRQTLKLESETLALATDPDGRRIYALREDPTPAIVTYVVPRAGTNPTGAVP